MDNTNLQQKYDSMHSQGPSAWFSDGINERNMIYRFIDSWRGLNVLEIGCGEGDLSAMLAMAGATVTALDTSAVAINKAEDKHRFPQLLFLTLDYREYAETEIKYDVVVMQGVLEHLDKPWDELRWIILNLLDDHGVLITSSPCRMNPWGMAWMTCKLLFDVPMSRTDLHDLHPRQFSDFADRMELELAIRSADIRWATGDEMVGDAKQRLPKALADRAKGMDLNIHRFVKYLEEVSQDWVTNNWQIAGATAAYKFWRENDANTQR